MHIPFTKTHSTQGGVLIATLVTALIIGGILTTYLVMVTGNQRATVRSEAWNRALPMAEAGIEEALAHLQRNYPSNMLIPDWTQDGATWKRQRRSMADGYYNVSISISTNPVLISSGSAYMPWSDSYVSRTVRVTTVPTSVFRRLIGTKEGINCHGFTIGTDSYDSQNPLYSGPRGEYDPTKARDHGDIATNLDTDQAVDVGNAKISGRVSTGPNGTVSVGPGGSVGSTDWHAAGSTGIEPGWSDDDANMPFPEVVLPYTGGVIPTGRQVGPQYYDFILGTDNYQVANFSGQVLVTGHAVIVVTSRCQFTGTDFIRILPNASLELYVACPTANIGGQGIINQSSRSTSFTYYGLPSNTSVSISGNGEFSGLIYAPDADITMNGGGNVYGAIMGKSLTMNGNFKFHFDEALSRLLKVWTFKITSWDEI